MYIGHLGAALGAKGVRRTVPLWVLVLAAQACDWGDVVVALRVPPRTLDSVLEMWTHSVPAVLAIAVVFAAVYWVVRRDGRGAALVGAVVISHVLLDYITGHKPTWPGGPEIGLQLYARPAWDFAAEAVVIVVGWLVYVRSLPNGRGWWRPAWVLLGALLVLQLLADGAFEYRADGGVRRARVVREGLRRGGGVG